MLVDDPVVDVEAVVVHAAAEVRVSVLGEAPVAAVEAAVVHATVEVSVSVLVEGPLSAVQAVVVHTSVETWAAAPVACGCGWAPGDGRRAGVRATVSGFGEPNDKRHS